MTRIGGVDLPNDKRIEAALPYIFGIGLKLAKGIVASCKLNGDTRVKNLTEDEVNKLQRELENYKIEGDLRREIQSNIKRLQDIESYRGIRHRKHLPVRGQRTNVNARTKRGKKQTVGTVRKEVVSRMGQVSQGQQKEVKK